MPRDLWLWQFGVLLIVYAIGTEFIWTYEQIETIMGLSEGEWFAVVLSSFALVFGVLYWHARRAVKGTVTAAVLERENGPAIPLAGVEKIVREGGGFPAVVFSVEGQEKVYLEDRDFIKLAQTRLNKWTIDGDHKLTVEPGVGEQELQISYAPTGPYGNLFEMVRWMLIFSISAKAFSGAFWIAKLLFRVSLCFFPFCLLIYYRRVKISLAGDNVAIIRGNKAERFKISDVTSLERGMFQVKVTANTSEVYYFPRACILLPEIIEEYAGLAE